MAGRRPSFIEQTLLRDQHKRALRNFSTRNLAFCRRDFVNAPPEMDCACATASFGFPWDRRTQRIIDFENSRPMPKRFQLSAISRWQLLTGDSQKLPNRNIQKNRARFRKFVKILDAVIHFDFPAKFMQISGKGVCNLLRSAAWNWPAYGVSREPSTSANAEEAGASRGRNECAAIPAKSARAGSWLKEKFGQ